jgi:hypothetical protein
MKKTLLYNPTAQFWVGFILGPTGLMMLGWFFKPKCPNCNSSTTEGVSICSNCHTILRWE